MMTALIITVIVLALANIILMRMFLRGNEQLQSERISVATHMQARQSAEAQCFQLQEQLVQLNSEYQSLQNQYAERGANLSTLRLQLDEARQSTQTLSTELQAQFKNLATEVLRERSALLDARNDETLRPLREQLEVFARSVNDAYIHEREQRTSLRSEIEKLIQSSLTLGREADQLSRALRGDNKIQGDWGEMILERILTQSGLREGEEYVTQQSYLDEDGNKLRPDIVVRYPSGGSIIIDSKVSLTNYVKYVHAELEEERTAAAKAHLLSVQRHIDELSKKDYSQLIEGSADFVMLFIPNEPAYTLALQTKPDLWEYAYNKRIVLINGTNLIAALRMTQDMWQRDRQIRNVEQIIDEVSKMYDKFCNLAENLQTTEQRLQSAQKSLSDASAQLSTGKGNVIRQLEKVRKMGLRVKKEIPQALQDRAELED